MPIHELRFSSQNKPAKKSLNIFFFSVFLFFMLPPTSTNTYCDLFLIPVSHFLQCMSKMHPACLHHFFRINIKIYLKNSTVLGIAVGSCLYLPIQKRKTVTIFQAHELSFSSHSSNSLCSLHWTLYFSLSSLINTSWWSQSIWQIPTIFWLKFRWDHQWCSPLGDQSHQQL